MAHNYFVMTLHLIVVQSARVMRLRLAGSGNSQQRRCGNGWTLLPMKHGLKVVATADKVGRL